MTTGAWYALTPTSTPFLFFRVEWGGAGRSAQARGWHVHRDGTGQGTVRPARQALRRREIPAPEGEAYRECERRLRERL